MHDDLTPLAAAARAGEPRAAERLIDATYAAIYAFLRRLAGNDADAADLTQKTYARAWTGLERFAGRASFKSWLHGVARHVFLDWLRSNHRSEPVSAAWWDGLASPAATPAEAAATADLAAQVYAAVERLEADVRLTVHLHYYQALTLEETAEALGTATSTVKYRLRQGIDQLRSRFTERPASRSVTTPIPTRRS